MLPLLARLLIGALFVLLGTRSILAFAGSVGYFAKLGFPAPEAMVVLSIVVQLAGGILLAIGWQTRWAAWLLAVSPWHVHRSRFANPTAMVPTMVVVSCAEMPRTMRMTRMSRCLGVKVRSRLPVRSASSRRRVICSGSSSVSRMSGVSGVG